VAEPGLNENTGAKTAPPQKPHGDSSVRVQDPADASWQQRLLPYLVGTLVFLTLFFCAAIVWETRTIQNRMESALEVDIRPMANAEFRSNSAFLLEANLIERRYRAANVAELSRIYLVFLGFGTGMVMALVGSTFILGKLSEPETSIDGGGSSLKASLRSRSPGVILAFFGTVLMLATIYSKTEISVSDRAVYMAGGSEEAREPALSPKITENETPEIRSPGKDRQADTKTPAAPVLAGTNSDAPPAGLHLEMSPAPHLDGRYRLKGPSGPGTLLIHGKEVQFTASDGRKMQVKVSTIDASHIVFSVIDTNGGRQDYDGYLSDDNSIVGQTSYHGSYSTHPYGFVATRITAK